MKQLPSHLLHLALCLALCTLFVLPVLAQGEHAVSPISLANVEKAWKFGPEQLAVLRTAFKQRTGSEIIALHATGIPGLLANMIDEQWSFTWQGRKFIVSGGNASIHMSRNDTMAGIGALEYEVNTESGKTIFTWSDETNAGQDVQSLCVVQGDSLIAEVVNTSGQKTRKVFTHLAAPYGAPVDHMKVDRLTVGEKFPWTDFDAAELALKSKTSVISKKLAQPDPELAWVVQVDTTTTGSGEHDTAYLNAKADLVRMSAGGLDFVACSLETALAERQSTVSGIIAIETPLDCWIPRHKPLSSLTLLLSARCNGDAFLEQNARQLVTKVPNTTDEYRITALPETPPSESELKRPLPAGNKDIELALQPTSEFEADAQEIRQTAQDNVGATTNRYRQSLLLAQWVSQHVEWNAGVPDASALTTLRTRKADCTGFAALFVALARSLNIPARRVGGWKVTQDSCAGHAWGEVYLGRWVQIDPTMNQLVDATYIQESMVSPGMLNWAKVEALGVDGVVTTLDKSRPAWSINAGVYRNRLLGLSMAIPADAGFLGPHGDKLSEARQGDVPPDKVTPLLFSLHRPVKNADPEAVTVFISEGRDGETIDAVPYFEQAVKIAGYSSLTAYLKDHGTMAESFSFQSAGKNYASMSFRLPDGKHTTLYITNLTAGLALGFVYTGELVDNMHGIPLPPIIADLMESLKHTDPDLGPNLPKHNP